MTPQPTLHRRLLRRPLFDMILPASLAAVAVGAIEGTMIPIRHVRAYPRHLHLELIIPFATVGVNLS